MVALLAPLARVALALWTGAVACLALVAPALVRDLGARRAGDILAPLFRTVDLFGLGAAMLALLAFRGWRAWTAGAMGGLAALNVLVLGPRIAARAEPFALLHALSEGAWALILAGGIILLAARPSLGGSEARRR